MMKNDIEWKMVKLEDILRIGNGRDYKHLKSGDIPVYGTGGYMCSVSEYLYEGETVCIGRKGTIDVPQFHSGKIWTVDTLFYTHSFNGVYPKFIYEAIHVFLIIDELSGEQKETIKNIIQAFKLETGADIQFDSAIVKLVQKINLLNENFEFGLTAQ